MRDPPQLGPRAGAEPRFEPLDGELGPARPLSEAARLAHAEAVIARLRRPRRGLRVALLAAAVLAMTTGAFAAVELWGKREAPTEDRASSAPRKARRLQTAVRHSAPALPTAGPGGADAKRPGTAATPSAAPDERGAGPGLPPRSEHRALAAEPPVAPQRSPRDWLELANAARAAREFARAERLYLRVTSLYPGSDDAYAANLSAAELQSQHLGRPRQAIALYRELLAGRPSPSLDEQARAGLARAYAAVGEPEAERDTWRELLRAHPNSWFAEEARARLKQR